MQDYTKVNPDVKLDNCIHKVEQMKPKYQKQKCRVNLVLMPQGYIQGYKLPNYLLAYPNHAKAKRPGTPMILL
jgi:hypothetical protein